MYTSKCSAILLTCILLLVSAGSYASVFVSVDVSPMSIPADGKSCAQVLVTVLDQSGSSVADNTEVRLTTSAGDITPAVYTSGGRAVGILTSSVSPQIATINAYSNGGSGSVQVEFSSSDSEMLSMGTGIIRMLGNSLAYSVDRDTVICSGGATIEYKGTAIEASGIQVCQSKGQIKAQGNVKVKKGNESLSSDVLTYDIHSGKIYTADADGKSNIKAFDSNGLHSIETDEKKENIPDFTPLMVVDGKTWIIAEKITLIPNDKIMFFKASIYLGESKVVKVPYYSYSYQKRESILQQVRYTANDGILIDFPLYFQMTDSRTAALKLRYSGNGDDAGGYSKPRRGLSMGLEQDYSISDKNQGGIFVDSIGTATRAYELNHQLDFGSFLSGGRANISARYQPTSDYAKGLYNASLNINGNMPKYNYTLYSYFGGSKIQQYDSADPNTLEYVNQSTCTFKTIFRPKAPVISKSFGNIMPSLAVGYGNLIQSSGGGSSSSLYQSFGLSFNRRFSENRNANLNFNGTTSFIITSRGNTGTSFKFGPSLINRWANGSSALSYTVNMQSGATDSGYALSKQELGFNTYLYGADKWNTNSSITYGLDSKRLNLYSSLNYRMMKKWQFRSDYSLYKYVYDLGSNSYHYATSYLKLGIYHSLGMYEVGLAWSPDGQDYGIDNDRHLWIEFNGNGF